MYVKKNVTLARSRSRRHGVADVLVIDDDASMTEGCRQTLEANGYRAVVARSGREGIDRMRRSPPRVVLLDLKMPGMSGEQVLMEIPKIDTTIVSIIMTGYGTIESAVESMKSGAFDFLNKPFEPERLVESIRRAMKVSALQRDLKSREARAEAPSVDEESKDAQTSLLGALDALGGYYAAGLEKRDFLGELRYLETEAKYHAESLGEIKKKEKAIRDVVRDLRLVDEIVGQHGREESALLQILLDIQTKTRWLPRHILKWVSSRLNVPLARTYSIAHFYDALNLQPRGKHLVQVCTGTACHVRGAAGLLSRVSALLKIEPGQTDTEQRFTMQTVHCMGCCALAPVMKIDDSYYSNPSLKELRQIFEVYEEKEQKVCQN